MQIAKSKITKEWALFDTLINDTPGDKTYRIYNRGNDTILLLETNDTPFIADDDGEPIYKGERVRYKKGSGNLFLRAENSYSMVNIVEVE